MRTERLRVEYLPVGDLTPYERNARRHEKKDIDAIAASIVYAGFCDPIGIWGKQNLIVEGHGRLLAAQKLGMDSVPCIRLDHLDDEQRRAYALAHNRTAELSEWIMDIREEELAEISDVDMSLFGFDMGAVEDDEQSVEEDDFDEVPPEAPTAKAGDIYQLGRHRLMCGDSSSASDVQLLMGGAHADMVFTDPPYGVAIGDKNSVLNSVDNSGRYAQNIEGDTMSDSELYDILKPAFENIKASCKDDAVYFVTSPQGGSLGLMMMMMMKDAGLPVRHVLMWRKNSATFSLGCLDYDYQHEPIFYTWGKSHHNYRRGQFRSTVWEFDKPRKSNLHPTMKPVELVANAIMDGSQKNDIVLDAFGGSGTTLIASEQLERTCYMMEMDPKYVDVIIARYEKMTGGKAVLLTE